MAGIAHDKKLHFAAGTLISLAVFAVTEDIGISFAAGLIAGIAKEIYDKLSQKGTPEFADFIATALGAGFACLLIIMWLSLIQTQTGGITNGC